MTIGIAVTGPGAGLAAFEALRAVERVSRGAIGGFVSFVAIASDGSLLRAETQRGGTRTLFTSGEATGVAPPAAVAEARFAALMSSGPDRPDPLAQFTPGDPGAGLVTGHRLPNMPGVDGIPLNRAVLNSLAEGGTPAEAIEAVLARNPEADAGLIALDLQGRVHLANSAFVAQRSDLGSALIEDAQSGGAVAVLHNAIHPHHALASLAASVAMDRIAPADRCDFEIVLHAGLRIELGDENCLHLDAQDRVERLTVTQRSWLGQTYQGAAVNFAAAVRRGGVLIGRTTSEPYCVAADGRLLSISGRDAAPVPVRASLSPPAPCPARRSRSRGRAPPRRA